MSSLYLDIGNSYLKMAERKGAGWHILFDGKLNRIDEFINFLSSKKNPQKIILSSVRKDISEKLNKNLSDYKIHEYHKTDIPAELLDYKTPETLGLDRFLVCHAAWKESGKKNVIVIDAGSACTVDLMTEDGVFKGGIIMPGLQIIKTSMKNYLPELPQTPSSIPDTWPGKSTSECIEWGVNGGFLMALKGFINKYKKNVNDIEIYITGGNAKEVLEWMRYDESLHYKKNLIWDGLEEFERLIGSSIN